MIVKFEPDFGLICSMYNRYGQLSGMVEPIAGLFGTIAVVVSEVITGYSK